MRRYEPIHNDGAEYIWDAYDEPDYEDPSVQSLRASSFDKGSLEQDDAELHLDMPPVDEDRWEARQQPPQHGRTRQVQLTAGNWIVDYPVPTPVANAVLPAYREQSAPKEFTHMRYSAVTVSYTHLRAHETLR